MNDNLCLCGAKEVEAYLDGGSRVCEKGHVYHFCQPDSSKKYGWIKKCFCKSGVSCEKLQVAFKYSTPFATKCWDQQGI